MNPHNTHPGGRLQDLNPRSSPCTLGRYRVLAFSTGGIPGHVRPVRVGVLKDFEDSPR